MWPQRQVAGQTEKSEAMVLDGSHFGSNVTELAVVKLNFLSSVLQDCWKRQCSEGQQVREVMQ